MSYYTEPNTLLDVFPICESYAINPEDGEFIWCEGIQMEGIQSFPNAYDVEEGYGDFIGNFETALEYGKSYELLLYHGGTLDYNHYWYVWIDFDRDGVFSTDSSELLVDSLIIGGTEYEFVQTNISIPQTTEPGFYTLRIASSLYNDATGCGSFTYGEVEDYSIEVVEDNCLVIDWKPRVYASVDTFCLDSITLGLDALPDYFSAEWVLNGDTIASTDTTVFWIQSPGWYQVYYQAISDTTCVSMLSDSFQVFDGNCEIEESFVSLNAKVFLQGALWNAPNNNLMRDDLRLLSLLPLNEPFSTLESFNHYGNGGGEIVDSSLFQAMGDTAIVDWLLIEMRSDTMPEQLIATKSVLLQRNGTVVDVQGNRKIVFDLSLIHI